MSAAIHLRLLGYPQLFQGNVPLASLGGKKLLFLACLAEVNGQISRSELAFLLWEDVSPASAKTSLRQAIHQTTLLLEQHGIPLPFTSDRNSIEWTGHADWTIDTHSLRNPSAFPEHRKPSQDTENSATQDFLQGHDTQCGQRLRKWITERREEYRQLRCQQRKPVFQPTLSELQHLVHLLEIMAVLGEPLRNDVLQGLSETEGIDCATALCLAENQGYITRSGYQGVYTTYHFADHSTQQRLLANLSDVQRRHLHLRCAQIFTERHAGLAEKQPEIVATHYQGAGMFREAVAWWQRAGELAMWFGSLKEAEHFYQNALSLTRLHLSRESGLELSILLKLGIPTQELYGYGDPRAAELYRQAVALAEKLNDEPSLCLALRGLEVCTPHRSYQECLPSRLRLLSSAQRIGDAMLIQAAHNAVADALLYMGRLQEAQTHLEAAYASYQSAPPNDMTAERASRNVMVENQGCLALGRLAVIQTLKGDWATAQQTIQQGLLLAEATEQPESAAFVHYWASLAHFLRRDRQGLLRHAYPMRELTEKHQLALYHSISLGLIGWGEGTLAHNYQDLLGNQTMQAFPEYPRLSSLLLLGVADDLVREKNYQAARQVLQELRPLIKQTSTYLITPEYLRLQALCALQNHGTRHPYLRAAAYWQAGQGRQQLNGSYS